MKIARWNVNSIKARLPNVLRWLSEEQPDIVGLQELKSVEEAIQHAGIEELSNKVETHGQKTNNGEALHSHIRPADSSSSVPHFEDEQTP